MMGNEIPIRIRTQSPNVPVFQYSSLWLALKEKEKNKIHFRRPSWEEYFMDITHLVAKRSTCLRRQVGAVLVKDKKILATGYNGAPSRLEHCLEVGCLRKRQSIPSGERHELCRGLHGEQNAIIQAAYHGVEIRGATLYCTNHPCIICSKMIINAGIERVVYEDGYADALAKEMLKESGILIEKFSRRKKEFNISGYKFQLKGQRIKKSLKRST